MNSANDASALVMRLLAEGQSRAEIIRQLAELCLGWPYVFAAAGEMCTPAWRRNRLAYSNEKYAKAIRDHCPVLSGKKQACQGCLWNGCRCFDCRGFTRWLLSQADIPIYGGTVTTQWETRSNWIARGDIRDMPRELVCCVFREGHTGMYMGNGYVIHCSGQVKKEALPGNPTWQRFGIPAGLYSNEELRKAGVQVDENKNLPTLRKGCAGEQVIALQTLLNEQDAASLTADGKFGAKTESAVRHFQELHDLNTDGIVGPKTWAALGIRAGHSSVSGEIEETEENIIVPRRKLIELKSCFNNALQIINQSLEEEQT